MMNLLLLPVLLFALCTPTTNACRERKLMTKYARSMIKSISPVAITGSLPLPSRYIAGVYLQRGSMEGMDDLTAIEEPFKLICHNETIAALQTKMKTAKQVKTTYEFSFTTFSNGKDVRGLLRLPLQDFFIDIDVEKDKADAQPQILGVYLTQPNDAFDIEITEGADHKDISKVKFHAQTIARMVFSRDFRAAVLKEITPRLEEFLKKNELSID